MPNKLVAVVGGLVVAALKRLLVCGWLLPNRLAAGAGLEKGLAVVEVLAVLPNRLLVVPAAVLALVKMLLVEGAVGCPPKGLAAVLALLKMFMILLNSNIFEIYKINYS